MVCGEGEAARYLRKPLDDFKRLCDDAVICLNHADQETERMVKHYGFKSFRDDREWGREQPRIKETLTAAIWQLNPDWIVALDADEQFDKNLTREGLEALTQKGPHAWHFYMTDLWNDANHYRPDMCFWKVQFYQVIKENGYAFRHQPFDPGIVPEWAASSAAYAPYLIKHYGLMTEESRQRRLARYKMFDPEQTWLPVQYYQALASSGGEEPFDEDVLHRAIEQEVSTYTLPKKILTIPPMDKFHFLRHKATHVVLDVPDRDLEETMKRGEFDYVREAAPLHLSVADVPIIEDTPQPEADQPMADVSASPEAPTEEIANKLKCILCGFEAKNEHGLIIHKGRRHAM